MITKSKGFTLLELAIIVTIMGLALAFAGPNMWSIVADNRITSSVNDYVAALQLAKAEAAARVSPTTICKANATRTGCVAGGDWQQGWIVFADANANATVDGGEQILLVHEALDSRITFGGTAQVRDFITYQPSGMTSITSAQELIMCDDRGFVDTARGVLVTITGRGSVMKVTDTGQVSCL